MSRTAQDSFNRTRPTRKEADAPHEKPALPAVNVCRNCTQGLHDLDCKGAILDLLTLTFVSCDCYCTRRVIFRGSEVSC